MPPAPRLTAVRGGRAPHPSDPAPTSDALIRCAAPRALLLLVSALACGGAGDARARTGETEAVASQAVGQAPVLTTRGVGPLVVGATVAEAAAALGGALELAPGADTAPCGYARWRGGPAGVGVMVERGRVVRVDVDSVGLRTAEGVGVGDAEGEVERRYAGRLTSTPHKYVAGRYLTVTEPSDTGSTIVFETAGGRVTRFRAGRRPAVEYVEGCS